MAKSRLRIKARKMRFKGESVKAIAKQLEINRGTVSLWVKDIILSVEQLEKLKINSIKGAERGRLISAFRQKEKLRIKKRECLEFGVNQIHDLSKRELLITGLALYWGEGSKKSRIVQLCNSDPNLVRFMIKWLKVCFNIPKKELSATVGINQTHKYRVNKVMAYWSEKTGIPLTQFRKTSFKKSLSKKVYSNKEEHFGTLSVKVLRPARIYYKILGLLEALSKAGMKPAFRNVS